MSKIFVAGSLNMDLTIQTDRVPGSGETVTGYGFITNPGGKGANQAAAAARLGAEVEMVGSVGQDGFGRELIAALGASGAHTGWIVRSPEHHTGVAMIIVSGGDNRIILDAGANGSVTGAQLCHALCGAQAGDYLVAQLEIPLPAVLQALKAARAGGLHTVLNPAPAVELTDEFFSAAELFVPNEHECALLCGIMPEDEDSMLRAGRWFLERGVGAAIITLGSRGAALINEDGLWLCPSPKVTAVDSTAAGDCFIGAMVSALARGDTLQRAVWMGTRAGALTVTRLGAQQSLPTQGELKRFIEGEGRE